MAAKQNNCGKGSKPSNARSRFSVPLKRKADEPLNTKHNDASISHLSATNLSSPSTLSHFSSINHSKDKTVDNHSIQDHPCQNYETKDISLICNQPIEVKHVSYDTPSMLHSHLHSNHSIDSSPNYHSNYSVDKLASHEDTNSIRDVQGNSNDLFSYKDIQTQNGNKTWDEDVLRVQNNGEKLKQASSQASVQMNQKTKGRLHSSRTRRQLIKAFNASAHQTSPIYESVACNSQGDSSFCTESINTGSMIPSQSCTYREHPTDQTTDGNVSHPCNENNFTDDKQPKCGQTEEKQAAVREIYICSICEKEFRQSGNFHKHMKSHTESHHYCKCGNCGAEFDNDEKLQQHMKKEHTGPNPYKCVLCFREFSQYNNLCRHLRSHREEIFICEICDKKCNEKHYLDMHMGSHTGHRIFSCGVCAKQFTSTIDLNKHINTHSESDLHVCKVCKKAFSKACVLRQHMKIHDGKRPYSCKLCHKSYIYPHHLKTHMRSHTKSKLFPCKLCNKEFSQISHFNKHQKQHLAEVSLSVSSLEESNGPEEKMNTLQNTSIPDELNGVPSNLQQKPKAKPVQKRSRGPKKKAVSTTSPAYLHHASQISEANPNPSNSSDSCTVGPLSNEATQNVTKEMRYFPLPDHLTHQNPMYMAFAPAFIAAHCTNLNMMKYQTHSGNGLQNDYAQDKFFLNRTPLSYESPKPLSHTRDFSPTVSSARSTPVSSVSIYKEHKQYFHNSTFAKPVEFLNCNMPVPVNGPFDFSLHATQKRSKYGSIGENDMEDLSSRGSHGSSSPYATSSVSSQPDTLSHSRDSSPIDHLMSTINSTKPLRQDQSKLDRFPLEHLAMITSQSNSKHPLLHPLRSSLHSVHRKEYNDSECNKPVRISSFPDDSSIQQKRMRLRNYSSNMDFKRRKMLKSPDLARSTDVEDIKLENYRKMKVKDEKLDELKDQAYAEENQGEDTTSQPDEISCFNQQIKEVREMIQHEIQKKSLDAMIDNEEEEEKEEGRLVIVEQATERQAHDNETFVAENAKLKKKYLVVCQNEKMFSQRIQHDLKNVFRRDTLQEPQIGSICCKKSVDSRECIHGTYEEKTIQQVSADLRWANNVETSRSHSIVQTNSPFDILQPTASLPYQRAVNDFDFKDSSGIVLDMSMKHSPAEKQQIHWKQMGDKKSACRACLTTMDTGFDLFKHLTANIQCYQVYIAKQLCESESSSSEEPALKLAKKYACQGMRDEGIYVDQKPLEEPMDLTKKASSKIKSRTVENLSDHNESKYHVFCKCCKKPMLNEVALSLHLSKNQRCFHSHYWGCSPVSLCKIDNDCSTNSGTLRQIMDPPSGRTSEPTTDRGNKASLNCDMIASQTVRGSQLHVPVTSQHHLPGLHYMPIMAHYNQFISSSQPQIYLLHQEPLYPVYSGGPLHKEHEQSFPLALVKKETSYVDPISTPRNCVGMPVEEKIGVDMRKSVLTTKARFCCGICYKSFPSSSDLEAHQNKHVPQKDGYYTCKFCDSVFSIPFDYHCHMLTHTGANEMQQHNDTTEETRSLRNRKSIEQGQPYLNISDIKNDINRQYKCDICEEVFEQVKFYNDHMETHTGKKPYRCPQCSRGFAFTHNLNRHLLSHNAKTVLCSVCGRGFKGSLYLQMHMKVHAEVKNCRCEICGQHIPKSDLVQHIIAHLSTLDQKFSGDGISFSAVNEYLKKYFPVSEGLETLDDIMAELKDFQAGKEKEDDGEANFSSVSDGSVQSSNDESKHNRTKGKRTQKKFEQVCLICNLVFKTKREFGNHLGVHNGERTHICKSCGKGFKKRCILKQHEKIHSSVRPFKCEVCGAYFLHYHHIQTHSHVHTGDKPYKCHICGVGFKHSSNLPKHLEMHKLDSRNQNDNQSKDI
ncbi:hypothetical protein CHS0354_003052 [Potamilus streckersoni]|uniref:C2H2-type domain-containing protein n=1 Tax=Potamilus streckersoni TaxID=2493646 RepID=A0AAE0TBN7_9BIVA|nr:hypothetical protein CHS0354_003052 [Potamilus streckersoni]